MTEQLHHGCKGTWACPFMSHGEMSECPHDAEGKSRDQLQLRSVPFPGDPREGKSLANGMLAKATRTRG